MSRSPRRPSPSGLSLHGPAHRHRLRQRRRLQGRARRPSTNWAPRCSRSGVAPNGFNINDECGSTHPARHGRGGQGYRADIGIALDGDADRLVICDEKGQVVDGDQIMAMIAGDWAERGRLTGGGVVATVMSNLGLERVPERPTA